MDQSQLMRFELALTVGRERLEGVLVDRSGAESRFRGWLELVAALERARAAGRLEPRLKEGE
jgi:hypothetical protein